MGGHTALETPLRAQGPFPRVTSRQARVWPAGGGGCRPHWRGPACRHRAPGSARCHCHQGPKLKRRRFLLDPLGRKRPSGNPLNVTPSSGRLSHPTELLGFSRRTGEGRGCLPLLLQWAVWPWASDSWAWTSDYIPPPQRDGPEGTVPASPRTELTGDEELPPKKVTRNQVAMKTQVAEKPGSSGK